MRQRPESYPIAGTLSVRWRAETISGALWCRQMRFRSFARQPQKKCQGETEIPFCKRGEVEPGMGLSVRSKSLDFFGRKSKSEETWGSPMFPISGDIRRGLHPHSQSAQESVLRRIDYDSHVAWPYYQVPRIWLHNALEFFNSPIKSAGGCIRVQQANALIQRMD